MAARFVLPRASLGVLCSLILVVTASPARAQDDSRVEVTSLTIDGAKAIPASRLKSVLRTHATSWIPFARKSFFDRGAFEADLKSIEAYYGDHGYPDARVTSFDAKLKENQRQIDLTITVDEGDPVVVDGVVLEGLAGLAGLTARDVRNLRARVPIKAGDVRDEATVMSTQGMIARALQDRGYPFSRVAVEERAGRGDHHIVLAFVGLVGESAVFGPISVAGNANVGDNVIRRALSFAPGDRFSLATIQQSQKRLYDLDLFTLVNVKNAVEQPVDGQVPITVTVAEADQHEIRFSAGYGSEERLRGEAILRHLNFLGGARTASLQGKWSFLDRGIRAEFQQPYLLLPDLSLGLSAQRWFADEPAYKLHTRGGRATLTQQLSRPDVVTGRGAVMSLSAAWIYEREEFSIATDALADLSVRDQLIGLGLDPRTGTGAGLLNALALDFRRSTTADVLNSSRGYVAQVHLERGGGLLPGDYDYAEWTAEARHYVTLGRLGVLANRAHAGAISGRGSEEQSVPFFKRYFLGGSNSLRGWGRFQVAPLSGSGLPLGGHSMLELSSELRVPLAGRVGVVAFADAGNVWTSPSGITLSDLRFDAGPGLRYLSPVGPLRVDLAFQLNPIPGLLVDGKPQPRAWRLHFSIGQTF